MTRKHLFASITKVDEQADGTIYVEGVASTESRDSQGEIVKASAMKAALPDYMKFGALREMHDAKAAGRALSAVVGDDGCTYIQAKVVDPVACKKVKERVYNGFSIGGNVPPGGRNKKDDTVIERLNLVEISLVDRPANPDSVITLFKAALPAAKERHVSDEEKKAAEKAEELAKAAAEKKAGEEAAAAEAASDEKLAAQIAAKAKLKKLKKKMKGFEKLAKGEPADTAEIIAERDRAAKKAKKLKKAMKRAKKLAKLEKRADEYKAAAVEIGEAFKKVKGERDELAKRVADLEATVETRGALRVVPVNKADDAGGVVQKSDEKRPELKGVPGTPEYEQSSQELAKYEMRQVYRAPPTLTVS